MEKIYSKFSKKHIFFSKNQKTQFLIVKIKKNQNIPFLPVLIFSIFFCISLLKALLRWLLSWTALVTCLDWKIFFLTIISKDGSNPIDLNRFFSSEERVDPMRLAETSEALHKLHLFPVTTLETQLLHTRHWQEVRRILRKEDTEKYREFQARFSLSDCDQTQ